MASMILLHLPLDHTSFLYGTLFILLVSAGFGLPLPEEVTLLLGGYLAYLGFTDYWATVYVLISGIIVADICGYLLGRFAGEWIVSRVSHYRYVDLVLKKAELYFKKHGEKVILFSRPLMGVRVAVPILSGHFRMKFSHFLAYDALASIPWTFLLVSASYYLGSGLDIITEVREVKHTIYFLLGGAIILYAAVQFIREKKSAEIENKP